MQLAPIDEVVVDDVIECDDIVSFFIFLFKFIFKLNKYN